MVFETVKGTKDYLGEEARIREAIKNIIAEKFKIYGFESAETPLIEFESFVKGENEFDEAVSDIFKLKDKGMRDLALRYELTFPLKRISQNKKLPYRRYQIGQVFRDEPVSGNRFREFTQADADVVGSSVKDEAELLAMASAILEEFGIKFEIQVNSRKILNSVIKELGIDNVYFVLREIDKIDKQGEDFVKANLAKFISKDKIIELFSILGKKLDSFSKFEGYKEMKELIKLSGFYNIKLKFNPSIIRGLSYYNGNIWEIKTAGMKETITGGGSYMINGVQSTGISFGIDRLMQLAKIKNKEKKVLIININQDKKSIELAGKIRKLGISCSISDRVSKGLEFANSYAIPQVIFLGDEEVKKKKFKIRDMKTGKESLLGEKSLIDRLKEN